MTQRSQPGPADDPFLAQKLEQGPKRVQIGLKRQKSTIMYKFNREIKTTLTAEKDF
jgi:hypothetical protein